MNHRTPACLAAHVVHFIVGRVSCACFLLSWMISKGEQAARGAFLCSWPPNAVASLPNLEVTIALSQKGSRNDRNSYHVFRERHVITDTATGTIEMNWVRR